MRLSATARAILGAIGLGATSGYEVKRLIEDAAAFFWKTSYGRIYPELQRLEGEGLLESSDDPNGGRARRRYALSDEGRDTLHDWLTSDELPSFELRDEGLLMLASAEGCDPAITIAILERMVRRHEQTLLDLAAAEPLVAHLANAHVVWEGGVELHTFYRDLCRRTIARLEAATGG